MERTITKLKGHFILCGYGRVGQEIARIFTEEGVSFVIIDKDRENIATAEKDGYLYMPGDATSDEALEEAGIKRARGLVIAVGNDADSVYITLSARGLRPDLFIEARASSSAAGAKLKKAGADRVIAPYSLGARRMAQPWSRVADRKYNSKPRLSFSWSNCRRNSPSYQSCYPGNK